MNDFRQEAGYWTNNDLMPSETKIYNSKLDAILLLLFGLACCSLGWWCYNMASSKKEGLIVGGFFFLLGGLGVYRSFKNLINTGPQIIISDRGIKTSETKFHSWSEIRNEKIISKVGSQGNISNYLSYNCSGGIIIFNYDHCSVDPQELKNLLKIYRGRYKKNYPGRFKGRNK